MAKHRGWTVHQPGSRSVSYPSRSRARGVARQLSGSSVTGSGCLLALLTAPLHLAAALLRRR